MTAADQATTSAETRTERRVREAAERAEWDRFSAIDFAHLNAIASGQVHCFCGTLHDGRQPVAELDCQAARDPMRRPTAVQTANRGSAHQDHTQPLPDQTRREQLARWYGEDRAAEQGVGDGDAE